ncbi:MAG: sensor histidine kinase, partial [Erysipelotrichales bacterium]|nr:sensor histidine kinase [Erysipelotrichales bacterium]
MKRFHDIIQELTLTQQLLVIIFFFTITFVSFFVAMLGPNIDTFVENQIYTVLELSQTDLIFSYEQG